MDTLGPLGDRAFLARFESEDGARRWASAVGGAEAGVEVVLAYRSVAVFADPDRIDLRRLEDALRRVEPDAVDPSAESAILEIPVLYDGEDRDEVEGRLGLGVEELIALHSGTIYDVFAVGFRPGFPYLGFLPAPLSGLARRGSPRMRVPAGSVAIAGRQSGVYPRESPGGWHLLGRTPLTIADLDSGHFPIRAGDRVRFVPIDGGRFEQLRGARLERPAIGP